MTSWSAGVIYGTVLGSVVTLILIGLTILRAEDRQRQREHFDEWERELGQ